MNRTQLEQLADRIEVVTGGRVTGGRVTPLEVRFNLRDCYAPDALGDDMRIEPRGLGAFEVILEQRPEPIPLESIESQLKSMDMDIPPLTATLGIADNGQPLLIRFSSPVVGNVRAPVELIPPILASLAGRHTRRTLVFAPATDACQIIESRERHGYSTPAVLLVGRGDDIGAELMRRGPGVRCYTLTAGADGLPFGVYIARHDGDCRMIAWTNDRLIRFTPATATLIPETIREVIPDGNYTMPTMWSAKKLA